MAYIRRKTSDDATWQRAWTADTLADLATISAILGSERPHHGDIAYVTANSNYYLWLDNGSWAQITGLNAGSTSQSIILGMDGIDGNDGFTIPGPAGPTGPIGPQGATGANGQNGIPGENGYDGENQYYIIPSPATTIPTFTTGSVIFAGASGSLSQNNSKLFWDDTNKRLGIGTATPNQPLLLQSDASGNSFGCIGRAAGNFAFVNFYKSDASTLASYFGGNDTAMQLVSVAGEVDVITSGAAPVKIFTNGLTAITVSSGQAVQFNAYGAGTLQTDASGNITAVSDERLKDRITNLPYGLSEILNLRPIQFGWNKLSGFDTDGMYGGFSAQQVKEIMPLCVGVDANGYYTLSDRPILGALVNSIKELNEKVSQLTNKKCTIWDRIIRYFRN